jgi:hypothetical protein
MTHLVPTQSDADASAAQPGASHFPQSDADLKALFEGQRVVHRRVDSVCAGQVTLELGSSTLKVSAHFLPPVQPGQWLRFSRERGEVVVRVDLPTTLKAEARLTSLFSLLLAPEPRPSS